MAGSLGLGPDQFRGLTLRQLLWMVEGHGREQWAHTSVLCALVANAHRDPKKQRPFKPDDFNPYLDPRNRHDRSPHTDEDVIEVDTDTVSLMRAAFTGRSPEQPSPQKGL